MRTKPLSGFRQGMAGMSRDSGLGHPGFGYAYGALGKASV